MSTEGEIMELSVRDAKCKVKAKWPRAYCLKDGGMYYIFGNPPRDGYGAIIRPYLKHRGSDMLSAGETEREAWNGVEGL